MSRRSVRKRRHEQAASAESIEFDGGSLLPPCSALDPVYWVDAARGNDWNDGMSPGSALRTFASLKETVVDHSVHVNILADFVSLDSDKDRSRSNPYADGALYAPPHLRRLLCPLPTDRLSTLHVRTDAAHGFIHASREALAEKMDLELGTLALVGSTYYRLEEAVVDGLPPHTVTTLNPHPNGWSLRPVDAPPQRGYFRKVVIR